MSAESYAAEQFAKALLLPEFRERLTNVGGDASGPERHIVVAASTPIGEVLSRVTTSVVAVYDDEAEHGFTLALMETEW